MERSILEASKAAAAMEGVAESMKVNAREVVRSVELQRRYGQMQLRPYLTVLVGEGVWQDKNLRFQVRPKVLNTGHTPAKDVRWRINIGVVPVKDIDAFRFPLQPAFGRNMIAPHQDYLLDAILPHRLADDDAEEIKAGVGDSALIVWGCISYRDSLKRRYLTTFAQHVFWVPVRAPDGSLDFRMSGRFLHKHNRAN